MKVILLSDTPNKIICSPKDYIQFQKFLSDKFNLPVEASTMCVNGIGLGVDDTPLESLQMEIRCPIKQEDK